MRTRSCTRALGPLRPCHLDERLTALDLRQPVDQEVTVELPVGGRWERMALLYEHVAAVVAASATPPLIISGDCTTSLGVLAGLQRARREVGIIWFDAHADFHTEDTTTSGYLGGMPLAQAVGLGTLTLPTALRLRPVPEQRVVLVDARDTDPGEQVLLDRSAVVRTRVGDVDVADLPDGPLYVHVDMDVCDPRENDQTIVCPVNRVPSHRVSPERVKSRHRPPSGL